MLIIVIGLENKEVGDAHSTYCATKIRKTTYIQKYFSFYFGY